MKILPSPGIARYSLVACFSAFAFARLAAADEPAKWSVSADHENDLYHVGETATFTVKVEPGSAIAPDAKLYWRTNKDGVAPVSTGEIKLEGGTATFTGVLGEAGFLQCRVTTEPDGKGSATQTGVAFDPGTIKPSMEVPDEFKSFWQDQLTRLSVVPAIPTLTPVKLAEGKPIEAYDTRVGCLGAPVSGYFAKPTGAKPKSLPAILTLHGAGVRSAGLATAVTWASQGLLAMDINAHGIPNGKDDAFYKELLEGELKDYRFRDRQSRERNYFVGMFLRAARAMEFLCAQPEWDGKTLIVYGGSQGGFQAFAAAALDERVTLMVALVPAGCDHSGMLANRIAGWPKFVPMGEDGKRDAEALEASRYIDCVNFAAMSKAEEAIVTVGFIDPTCPPTSVYAAYNALAIKDKQIFNDLNATHTPSSKAQIAVKAAVQKHLSR